MKDVYYPRSRSRQVVNEHRLCCRCGELLRPKQIGLEKEVKYEVAKTKSRADS